MAGFVNVEDVLIRQHIEQLFVGGPYGKHALANDFGKVAFGNLRIKNIAAVFFDTGKGHGADELEEAYCSAEMLFEEARLNRRGWEIGIVKFSAMRTPVGVGFVLDLLHGFFNQLYLLKNAILIGTRQQLPGAVGAAGELVFVKG